MPSAGALWLAGGVDRAWIHSRFSFLDLRICANDNARDYRWAGYLIAKIKITNYSIISNAAIFMHVHTYS